MTHRLRLIPAALAILAACSDSPAEMPQAVVRDSAGIAIVENPAVADLPALALSEPTVQIGTIEGADEYQLHNVRGAVRLSDGRIALSSGSEVRFYAPDGTYIRTTGRQGSGPGEFSGISYLRALDGDSLLVFDAFNRRVTVLAPDGTYARDYTPGASVAAATRDGALLTRRNTRLPDGSVNFHRTTLEFSIQRGDSTAPLRGYPGPEMDVRIEGSGGEIMSVSLSGVPFSRPVHVAAGADRFYIGSSDTWEIHEWGPDGALKRIVRSAETPLAVDDELLSAYTSAEIEMRRQFAEREGEQIDEADVRRQIAEQQHPPTAPAYDGLVGTEEGGVWVREFAVPAVEKAPARWTIVDAAGRITGMIELPARFTPMHIQGNTVVGVIEDELDVEYVRVYTFS